MKDTDQSMRCRVEIYQSSFINKPAVSFETSAPFPPVHVGDYLDRRKWAEADSAGTDISPDHHLRVKAVNNLICTVGGAQPEHTVSICVEVLPPPSPTNLQPDNAKSRRDDDTAV